MSIRSDPSEAYGTATWQVVHLPCDVCEDDILRALRITQFPARYAGPTLGGQVIEVFCSSTKELSEAEALLSQALADQKLRREIEASASDRITRIVDAVVFRVSGQ
jgi:hypothetical protein